MISLAHMISQYPVHLQGYRSSILKEYLQYKILASIYSSIYHDKLVFLGGTALRILHGNTRFSEDLDFDNLGIQASEFIDLGKKIQKDLEMEGLQVDIIPKTNQAYRLDIRIPAILFDLGLSSVPSQKILIQVDTVPQNFSYIPDTIILNKFEIFTQILSTPQDILLSQKIYASLNRKRVMGRDFFDIIFLYGMGVQPNFEYLTKHLNISNKQDLQAFFLTQTQSFDFQTLAQDLTPFLFYPEDRKKVELFRDFVAQW